jgi:hypothetical protein
MSVPATAIADAYDRLAQQAVALRYVRRARRHAKAPAALPMRRLVQAMGVAIRTSEVHRCYQSRSRRSGSTPGRCIRVGCRDEQLDADTKRTHQKRRARRLATHLWGPPRVDLQEKPCHA